MKQPNPEQSLRSIVELARSITGADGAAIALRLGDDVLCHARSGPIAPELGAPLDPQSGLSGECLRSGEIQQCDDAETDPRVDIRVCRKLGIRSVLAIPVRRQEDVLGIVEVLSDSPRGFAEGDIDTLKLLSELIVKALEAQQVEECRVPPSELAQSAQLSLAALLRPEPPPETVAVEVPLPMLADGEIGVPVALLESPRTGKRRSLWRALTILVVVLMVLVGGNEAVSSRGVHVQRVLHSKYADFVLAPSTSTPAPSAPAITPDVSQVHPLDTVANTNPETAGPNRPGAGANQGLPETLPVEESNGLEKPALRHKLTIAIDPGHGGADTGAVGPGGVKEKDVVLTISKRLGEMLAKRLAAEVIFTRTIDRNVPLEVRAGTANKAAADLFVSIHANYSADASTRGAETYYVDGSASSTGLDIAARENATTARAGTVLKPVSEDHKLRESRMLAAEVQKALSQVLGVPEGALKNRGVKRAPFVVLLDAEMPSILTEIAFVTSPVEAQKLSSAEGQETLAEGLYQGIARYLAASKRNKVVASAGAFGGQ